MSQDQIKASRVVHGEPKIWLSLSPDTSAPVWLRIALGRPVWLGTINIADPSYIRKILTHSEVNRFIRGIGLQWAGQDAIATVHQEFPQLPIWQTETECGNGSNDWDDSVHTWELMKRYLGNGAQAYMAWNMILDETGKSTWGWKQNSLATVNTEGGVIYHPEYYLFRHFSQFVEPGSRMVETVGASDLLAFLTPKGALVLVTSNQEARPHFFSVRIGSSSFSVTLPSRSYSTFVIRDLASAR